MKAVVLLGWTALLWSGCDLSWFPLVSAPAPSVCLQVTETSDPQAFDRIMSELQARGFLAAVLVDADFATANCERLRALDAEGYELMAFARPDDALGETATLSMLSYEAQQALIANVKTAIESCLSKTIQGFRCYRFDQNEDTYRIMDELGFTFNLGFVAHSAGAFAGHEDDTSPHQAPGYGFWAVPMHSVYTTNRWSAFCDMPFQSLDAATWGALLKSELDRQRLAQQPLLVEVHPYYSGVDEGRFQAFVEFLDYAQAHGAQFITVTELVQEAGGDAVQTAADGADTTATDGGCSCQE